MRKHEMELMKLKFDQQHSPSEMPFRYHSPPPNGNSSRFQQIFIIKITSLQKEKDTPRIRILSKLCYNHHFLTHIILQRLPIKEIITSKQFYQFCSILLNWKTERKTNVSHLYKALVISLTWFKYLPKRNA